MSNVHTSSTCHVYLITAVVPFPHRQLVELPCDMFSGAGVCIPVGVNAVVVGDVVGCLLFFMLIIIPLPAGSCFASMELVADLALRVVALLLLLLLWLRAKTLLVTTAATPATRGRRGAVSSTAAPSVASATASPAAGLSAPSIYGVGRGAETCWTVAQHLHPLIKRSDLCEEVVDGDGVFDGADRCHDGIVVPINAN